MLKQILILSWLALPLLGADAIDPKRMANTVVLDELGVKNLRIETVEVEETDFETTAFALGRIEAIPAKRSGVSSRIPGRITHLKYSLGDTVEAGAEVATLESRQPGDPPPTITLKCTTGGLVTKAEVAVGQPLEPEQSLLEITDLSEVYAIARVPEQLAGKLKAGGTARIKVSSLPDEPFEGELLSFGTEANRETGTIDAIFKIANAKLTLRPGMRAEFSLILSKREAVLSVPRLALQGEESARFVYVKDFELKHAFVKSPVEVGEVNDRFAEILAGVIVADEVVTRGAYSLAFAGGGSVSLKEALDAAHGHEHNEDGSELSAEQKAQKTPEASGDDHDHDHEHGGDGKLWKIISGVLALLLVAQMFLKAKPSNQEVVS